MYPSSSPSLPFNDAHIEFQPISDPLPDILDQVSLFLSRCHVC